MLSSSSFDNFNRFIFIASFNSLLRCSCDTSFNEDRFSPGNSNSSLGDTVIDGSCFANSPSNREINASSILNSVAGRLRRLSIARWSSVTDSQNTNRLKSLKRL